MKIITQLHQKNKNGGRPELERAIQFFEQRYPQQKFEWKIQRQRAIAHCPFHSPDKHPSFNIYVGRDNRMHYHCFSCQAGGVMTAKGINAEEKEEEKNGEQNKSNLQSFYETQRIAYK